MMQMYTIESDDEIEPEIASDEEDSVNESFNITNKKNLANKKAKKASKSSNNSRNELNKKPFHFEFDDGESNYNTIYRNLLKSFNPSKTVDNTDEKQLDTGDSDYLRLMPHSQERIFRAQEKKKKKNLISKETDEESSHGEDNDDDEIEESEHNAIANNKNQSNGSNAYGMTEDEENDYFDAVLNTASNKNKSDSKQTTGSLDDNTNGHMFTELSLSRPLLRGIEAAGYITPTPVQWSVIPLALAGRDVCASAATGSGKTAAFLLPCLERLQYRSRDTAAIRVLVVTPTRELATQIYNVLQKLSAYTDVTSALICGGGRDLRSQETTLRLRPDIVICTPGRILDHLRNSASVRIDELDVLILDEVDRLLDLGFQDEVEELVKQCPVNRQTLLFSATLTNKVDDLAKLSLRRPVRVKTSLSTGALAPRLIQEFIKIKNEDERESMLVSLIIRSFHNHTIVFCETKKETHRLFLILKLFDIQVAELHGNLTQPQRYKSLEQFRVNEVDVLVATDVAARGLDIPGVQTVINAEMTRDSSTYIHRVGRTARAGAGGRSVTLVSDARRKVVKDMLKMDAALLSSQTENNQTTNKSENVSTKGRILSRTIPSNIIHEYHTKITALETNIQELMLQEQIDNQMRNAVMEIEKTENLMKFSDEIHAKPARTWYQTETQKSQKKELFRQIVNDEKARIMKESSDDKLSGQNNETLTKQQILINKKNAILKNDDYREEKVAKGSIEKNHKLCRKKRRRNEALAEIAEDREREQQERAERIAAGGDAEKMNSNHKTKLKSNDNNAKSNKSIAEMGELREIKKRNRLQLEGAQNKKQTKDLMRPRFAVGGLDQDLGDYSGGSSVSIGGVNRKKVRLQDRKIEAELNYEYDPNKKLKKGGKSGTNSFKSKKRFKRR